MTLYKPTIIISELVVVKDGRDVLHTKFHKGLNIVSGHNSSGKTTTLDFIAHTLGAEDVPWKKEALLCDYSLLEVLLNDVPVTLRRDVNDEGQMRPLYIYWDSLEVARQAPFNSWEVYPFRRSANKLSFTQSLLLALDMPEAQGDGASNLTMHQFLRVIYADQPSLHSPIFRIDSFDSALTRATVGDYLSGVYDDRLYSAQLKKRELEKSLSLAESELRSIFTVLSKSQQDVNIEFFGQQIVDAERRRDDLQEKLDHLKSERTIEKDKKSNSDEGTRRAALDVAKKTLASALDGVARQEAEILDSKHFILEIESRLHSLEESETTRGYLGGLIFNFCPCCLSPVQVAAPETQTCSLCKTALGSPTGEAQLLRMRNELRIQLKESSGLLQTKEQDISALRLKIPGLRQELRRLEQRYIESTQSWSSALEQAMEKVLRELGGLDQEIRSLYESQKLASVIQTLQEKRNQLQFEIVELSSTIESLVRAQDVRKRDVQLAIAKATSRLLKLDMYRQEEFKTAENIQFSFADNQVTVDSISRFSESSTAVLRHLFHLAILTASTQIPEMRFPRLLILDGIEDGGMELPRSHRLQEIIAAECENYQVDYQLIMATSQIAPSLNRSEFVVGRRYTEEERALSIR